MTVTLQKYSPTSSETWEKFRFHQSGVPTLDEPLQQLARLAELRFPSERATRAANDGVDVLSAAACIIQCVSRAGVDRLSVIRCRPGVNPNHVGPIADALTARITDSGVALTIRNLRELFEKEAWLPECEAHSYLGVPIFDSNGSLSAVAAVLGDENHTFSEEAQCWLRLVGQLVSDSFVGEALALEIERLKQQALQDPSNVISGISSPANSQPMILVTDDDRQVNDFLCEFLTMKGYKVEHAYNGLEALQAFHPAKHDLVITDVAMPLMNGWELIAALRARSPLLPIVLISGYALGGELGQKHPSLPGVSAILTKPLDVGKLAAIVDSLVPISR